MNTQAIQAKLGASEILKIEEWAKVLWVKAIVNGKTVCRFVSKKVGLIAMSQFRQIIEKLQSIDCSISRSCSDLDDIARAENRDYSGMSGRQENQFEYVHQLVAAINGEKWFVQTNGVKMRLDSRQALSHVVSGGQLSF